MYFFFSAVLDSYSDILMLSQTDMEFTEELLDNSYENHVDIDENKGFSWDQLLIDDGSDIEIIA